ncbi:MAG TPA: hypothetical protein PL182_06425 [Pseudobdellovibrionaceae bacterium]|nr:hypothetical protein [Pseudobdellovibrionaceae bacterium]
MSRNSQAEKTRILRSVKFQEGQVETIPMPRDTTLRGIWITLKGSVKTTFASGTPVAKAESTMDSLISLIDFTVDGRNTIKSLRPHILHIQNLFAFGVETPRFCSAGASEVVPTTPANFTFGTTGQKTSIYESVYLPFEMIYCEPGWGRERTYVNLRNHSSAELRLVFNSFKNLLGFGNTAPVDFSDSTLTLEVSLVERSDDLANVVFDQWKQYMVDHPIAQEGKNLQYKVNVGNSITGLMLFARNGNPGSATTATGKTASNLLLSGIELRANGRDGLQSWKPGDLQGYNRSVYGVFAPVVNGVARTDGIYHLNMLNRRQLDTALKAVKPDIDDLHLMIDTNPAGVVDYTAGANLLMVTEELVEAIVPK